MWTGRTLVLSLDRAGGTRAPLRVAMIVLGAGLLGAGAPRPVYSQVPRTDSVWKGVGRNSTDPLKVSLTIMERITKRKDVTGYLKDMACGCQIDPRPGKVGEPFTCQAVIDAGSEEASMLKAVRIVAEEDLAAPMACFEDGISSCRKTPEFRQAIGDPHLVVVVPGPVADALEGYRLGPVESPIAPVAGCDVVLDKQKGTYAFHPRWHGFIARALLYAAEHYKVRTRLLPGELQRISNQYPPTVQERLMSLEGKPFGVPQETTDAAAIGQ